jgi:hypothetical protein
VSQDGPAFDKIGVLGPGSDRPDTPREEAAMFEEFLDLPFHPLLVHTAVTLVPLQIAAVLAYGLVPMVRRWTAWFVVATAVVGPLAALVAKLSGDAFRIRLVRNGTSDAGLLARIDEHRAFATNAVWASAALGVLALVLVAVLVGRARRAADPSQPAGSGSTVLTVILMLLILGTSGVTGYYLFQAGDSGARLVWTGL